VARADAARGGLLAGICVCAIASAGPPYVSDDPETTDYRHYEIYAFTQGVRTDGLTSGSSGIDFNYGAGPDLQLTAVIPVAYQRAFGSGTASGLENIELAAKYRFVHQASSGWDVAVFPRVFLPSASEAVGTRHASLLVPLWLERDWSQWSTFGGGGCALNHGAGARDYCMASWALARQLLPQLQVGAELVYQSPDAQGAGTTFSTGAGLRYDLGTTYHLLAYAGPGLANAGETDRYSWYAALLFTF
jgi:hypothetical protein